MPAPPMGRMNTRIRIEQNVRTADQGYHKDNWTHFATIWSAEDFRGSSDTLVKDRRMILANIDFTIHYRTDINATMRVVKNGVYFDILGIDYDVEDHLFTVLRCIEEALNA